MKMYIALFIVHICIILAMFDVYFQTNVLSGMSPVKCRTKSFANRLVLFVGDGLRSDTFFGRYGGVKNAPFLRSKMLKGASWGVSHTRVPTESRPGHVAMIAGFYEDPSAVFQGWKKNPVPFDSVFNQSVATFSWGSPDIVPLFSSDRTNPNIFYYNYNENDQDLSGKNGTVEFLNSWVLAKFKDMYRNIRRDKVMYNLWNKSGIVFFFHLLGIDAAGHAFNPDSVPYIESLHQTDEIVRNITSLIEKYYTDNKTAFIFTSDHGMTDWGSHGGGSVSETETPLVAWGSGIKLSNCSSRHFMPDSSCSRNVSQADIAVLMSVLLGQSIPVHSTGILPVEYLNISAKDKCDALLMNVEQLLEIYRRKQNDIKSSIANIFFLPFAGLQKGVVDFYLNRISQRAKSGFHEEGIKIIEELIDLVTEGTRYYDRYFQTIKLTFVALTIVGIICSVFSEIIPIVFVQELQEGTPQVISGRRNRFNFILIFVGMFSASLLYFILTGTSALPSRFVLYILLPVPFWFYAIYNNKWFWKVARIFERAGIRFYFEILFYLTGIILLYLSFYQRWMLTLLMFVVMFWPLIKLKVSEPVKGIWILSSFLVGLFPLLPTVGAKADVHLVILSGICWLIFGGVWILITKAEITNFVYDKKILLQTALIIPIIINTYTINYRFTTGKGLTNFNQFMSFGLLVTNLSTLFIKTSSFIFPKFLSICLSLGAMFLQFCSNFEGFFPIVLTFHLTIWIFMEASASSSSNNIIYSTIPEIKLQRLVIQPDSIRQSFFFLCYIVISYFGIGNIESINSFDLAWVRGFVTVFSPFLMTALVLLKTVIPFLMVTCAFRILVIRTQANVNQLFYFVLVFCDILGLLFLFSVTNEGSWLEIGKSISRFIIVEVTVLFLILLYGFASLLIPTIYDQSDLPLRKRHVS